MNRTSLYKIVFSTTLFCIGRNTYNTKDFALIISISQSIEDAPYEHRNTKTLCGAHCGIDIYSDNTRYFFCRINQETMQEEPALDGSTWIAIGLEAAWFPKRPNWLMLVILTLTNTFPFLSLTLWTVPGLDESTSYGKDGSKNKIRNFWKVRLSKSGFF